MLSNQMSEDTKPPISYDVEKKEAETKIITALPHLVWLAIFDGWKIRFKGKPLKVTKSFRGLRQIHLGNILFIEQNSKKSSQSAYEARQGKKILWIINKSNSKYAAKLVDNKLYRL